MMRLCRILIALTGLVFLAAEVEAGCRGGSCGGGGRGRLFGRRDRGSNESSYSYQSSYQSSYRSSTAAPIAAVVPVGTPVRCPHCGVQYECPQCKDKATVQPEKIAPRQNSAEEGAKVYVMPDTLIVVNEQRARRGLRPFLRDDGLSRAAWDCAHYRATYRLHGHSHNDFAFLPAGCHAASAGCAAWPQGMEFGACNVYENYQYAGAAQVIGDDGLAYNQIYVR